MILSGLALETTNGTKCLTRRWSTDYKALSALHD